MRKANRGPALFELLTGEEEASTGTPQRPAGSRPAAGRQGGGGALKMGPEGGPTTWNKHSRNAADGEQQAIPFVDLAGGRVRVSFTSVTAAAAVFVAMIALLRRSLGLTVCRSATTLPTWTA